MEIFQIIVTILLASVPIVIWGYVFSYHDGVKFDLQKFIFGSIAGAVSIVPVLYASQIYEWISFPGFLSAFSASVGSMGASSSNALGISLGNASLLVWFFIASFGIPVLVFLGFLLVFAFRNLTALGKTLGKILLLLGGTAIILAGVASFFPTFGTGALNIQGNVFTTLSSIIVVYIFIALLEESMKHLSLYGSLEVGFKRKDIILFAVYSALGFVFLENIVYLSHIGESSGFGSMFFGTLASRSIVSLLLHVFASLILALGFVKYTESVGISAAKAFVQAVVGGVFVHALFNISLTYGKTGIIFLYAFIGYFFFTKVFFDERGKVE